MKSRNYKWADAEHTMLDCEIEHKEFGWIPYTTGENDNGLGKEIWDNRDNLEIAEYEGLSDEILATQIRAKRDSLLNQTDYLMMPDYPVSDDNRKLIKEYRQALRDITEQDGFPQSVTFPQMPSMDKRNLL